VRVHNEPNSTITGSEGTTAAQRLTHDCALSLSSRSEASRNPASHVLLKEAERRRERTLTSARAAEECKWENVEAPLLIEPFRERERERDCPVQTLQRFSDDLRFMIHVKHTCTLFLRIIKQAACFFWEKKRLSFL